MTTETSHEKDFKLVIVSVLYRLRKASAAQSSHSRTAFRHETTTQQCCFRGSAYTMSFSICQYGVDKPVRM
jgi:hypothetical protein